MFVYICLAESVSSNELQMKFRSLAGEQLLVTDILKEFNAFIFQVKQSLGIKALHSFERLVSVYQSAGSKSPEGMSLHQAVWEP